MGINDRTIRITYEVITEASAMIGDVEESGWIDEDGVLMQLDQFDKEEGKTLVDLAVEFLESKRTDAGMEASSSDFSLGTWYTAYDVGSIERADTVNHAYHLVGFTEAEEYEIFKRITGSDRIA